MEGIKLKDLIIKILFFLSLVSSLFSLEITETKKFLQQITPDVYSINISISYETEELEEDGVRDYFYFLLKDLKEKKTSCVGGAYYIHPRYSKENKKSGFVGSTSFTCESTNIENIEDSLSLIKNLSKNKNAKLRQNPVRVYVSPKEVDEIKDSLRLEAIHYSSSYSKNLSSMTKKVCEVQGIDFTNSSSPRPMMRAEKLSVNIEEPIFEPQEISIRVKYRVLCK